MDTQSAETEQKPITEAEVKKLAVDAARKTAEAAVLRLEESVSKAQNSTDALILTGRYERAVENQRMLNMTLDLTRPVPFEVKMLFRYYAKSKCCSRQGYRDTCSSTVPSDERANAFKRDACHCIEKYMASKFPQFCAFGKGGILYFAAGQEIAISKAEDGTILGPRFTSTVTPPPPPPDAATKLSITPGL